MQLLICLALSRCTMSGNVEASCRRVSVPLGEEGRTALPCASCSCHISSNCPLSGTDDIGEVTSWRYLAQFMLVHELRLVYARSTLPSNDAFKNTLLNLLRRPPIRMGLGCLASESHLA